MNKWINIKIILCIIVLLLIVTSCFLMKTKYYYTTVGTMTKPQWVNDSVISSSREVYYAEEGFDHTQYFEKGNIVNLLFIANNEVVHVLDTNNNYVSKIIHYDCSNNDTIFISGLGYLTIFNITENDSFMMWQGDSIIKRGDLLEVSDEGDEFVYCTYEYAKSEWYYYKENCIEKYLYSGKAEVKDADMDWETGDHIMITSDEIMLNNIYTNQRITYTREYDVLNSTVSIFNSCRFGYDGNIEILCNHSTSTLILDRATLTPIDKKPEKQFETNSKGDYFVIDGVNIYIYDEEGNLILSKEIDYLL